MKTQKRRILVADPNIEIHKLIKNGKEAKEYQIETAFNGKECIKKLETFQPELVIVDFFLPCNHGIEILKKIKEAPLIQKTGVIITSYHSLLQNHHIAIKMGANYYLEKPFAEKTIFQLIKKYFENKLIPDPYPEESENIFDHSHTYAPETKQYNSYIKFWGTRGSNPVAGVDYIHFGGNTCCLEVRHGDDVLIIDAGTGIRVLGGEFSENTDKPYNILFSHTHWDHLLGFPFFKPIYHPNSEVNLYAPVGFDKSTKELFSDMLGYAYFPVALEDIKSKISFFEIRDSQKLSFGKIEVYTHYAFHPGSTLCFRIHVAGKKIGYVTDNEFLMGYLNHPKNAIKKDKLMQPYLSLIKFFEGCDLIIHEAQYTPSEYKQRQGWGHSSISNASVFVQEAGITDWIVTHHDPRHTDIDLLKKTQLHHDVLEEMDYPCRVRLAYDGMLVPIQ